ncbi:MAG: glycosyltransferase family 4 protein [Chloroflexi bacterium]|nr:glycosyltransferase family 4 protein [Chloroflexota bacterium]
MADVLLTVSGVIDPQVEDQVAQGLRPCPDYVVMARAFGATLLDYASARRMAGVVGRALEALGGPNLLLAWACCRQCRRYRVIFTDGEQVGIPLALLLKFLGWMLPARPRHMMIVHILSVGKKRIFFDWLGIQSHIHVFFVYSSWQKHFIETRWRVPAERVVLTPFMVDAQFFSPRAVTPRPQRLICAVGLERRDYLTLLQAVQGLDVRVMIAAASPWSKQTDTTQGQATPENVTVRRFSQYELRQLYADCCFMVMPLYDVEFQAGVTAILEAMAMERAVVCSRTRGQTDVITNGENGVYVPPGDPRALRETIERLLCQPQEAVRMGKAGRQLVEQAMSLERYVERLNRYVTPKTGQTPGVSETPGV